MSVTVVIATRDRPQLVRGALEAAKAALRPGDSLIMVDSASADPITIAGVAREAGANLIRCAEPGTSRARNAGWRAASTELVAFTDDDCLPDSRWLEAAVEAFTREPSAGFVTGRVDSESTHTPRAWLHLSLTSRTDPAKFGHDDDPTEIGHGANMVWRRSALEEIGGFDETLGPGAPLRAAEDVDAFWRSLMGGGVGVFDPDSIVAHRQWRGRVDQLRAYLGYGVGSGALAVKRWRLELGGDRRPSWGKIAGRASRELIWRHGVQGVVRNVAERYAMGSLSELAMLAGAAQGVVRARRMGLADGHFLTSS
ncbi:MAG TPA: glycosyltransferase [Acidimicrobiales bacterium]|nr:glycosyltransferase [Acidimicrobiales bacterium]